MGSEAAPLISASALAIAITALVKPISFHPDNWRRALSICHGGSASMDANSKDLLLLDCPETFANVLSDEANALTIKTGSVPVARALRKLISAIAVLPSSASSATSNPVLSTLPC